MFEYIISNPVIILFIILSLSIVSIVLYKRFQSKLNAEIKIIEDIKSLNEFIEPYGYAYDSHQDIFYTKIDAWQREMGYSRLYDEAAAPSSMIIDCEPIYFEYDNKRWLIEFWKGQYGMTTGFEIGVYHTVCEISL